MTLITRAVSATQRVAAAGEQSGSKQDKVRDYVLHQAPTRFRRRDVERALPGISLATIRLVLTELRDSGQIKQDQGTAGRRLISSSPVSPLHRATRSSQAARFRVQDHTAEPHSPVGCAKCTYSRRFSPLTRLRATTPLLVRVKRWIEVKGF